MSVSPLENKQSYPNFTRRQELVNALTHGLGALLAIAALVILVAAAARRGTAWHVAAYAVFGTSMVTLYLASTLYHAAREPRVKRVLEKFDHGAIYILIAGSYTAFALTILRGSAGWWLFGLVWAIAIGGILMESLFLNRWPYLSLLAYLAMGWLIVLVWDPLLRVAPPQMLFFLLAGGILYSLGTVFYALGRRIPWVHPVWHLFVIAGTVSHFFSALAALPPAGA